MNQAHVIHIPPLPLKPIALLRSQILTFPVIVHPGCSTLGLPVPLDRCSHVHHTPCPSVPLAYASLSCQLASKRCRRPGVPRPERLVCSGRVQYGLPIHEEDVLLPSPLNSVALEFWLEAMDESRRLDTPLLAVPLTAGSLDDTFSAVQPDHIKNNS